MNCSPWIFLASLLMLTEGTGCQRKTPPAPAPASSTPIALIKPEQRAIKRIVEQPGAVQAFEETALFAKIAAYVEAIADDPDKKDRPSYDRCIDIGSRVHKGQVLAKLSAPELDREFAQKEALIKQAQAEVTQANKALIAAREGVETAKATATEAEAGLVRAEAHRGRWRAELTRITGLIKSGVIDAGTRDETENQFNAADAAWNETRARVTATRAAVRKAEADRDKAAADEATAITRVEVARASLAQVDAMRGYLKITAPFDGVVTRRGVNTGDLVSAPERVALFRVARIDPVRIVVSVPEADAETAAVGQEVRFSLQSMHAPTEIGRITRTSWSLEPGSRTLRAEIDVPNAKGLVRPGMYVYARITAELPPAWTVPVAVVGRLGDDSILYLGESGKATRVLVQLGRGDNQFTQIRRYKKPAAAEWIEVTGAESIAAPASALSEGQNLP